MARPKSEERRNAILAAATKLVAEQGLGAATGEIAKQAGVPHGSVFTYFETKSALLNMLYIELTKELTDCLNVAIQLDDDVKCQFRKLWDAWINWGVDNHVKRRAQAQLHVSDQINEATRQNTYRYGENVIVLVRQASASGVLRDVPLGYIGSLVSAWAVTTIDHLVLYPTDADTLCDAGFESLWQAIT